MGVVVLLSPEVFILALLMAAHKSRARLNSVVFFLGSSPGLFFAIGVGLWITPNPTQGGQHHSWIHFALRAGIGTALFCLGIYRGWQFLSGKDDRTPKPKSQLTGIKEKFLKLFPSMDTDTEPPINFRYLLS